MGQLPQVGAARRTAGLLQLRKHTANCVMREPRSRGGENDAPPTSDFPFRFPLALFAGSNKQGLKAFVVDNFTFNLMVSLSISGRPIIIRADL
jgi:hypothetical protein